jgi:hypothetical protein
MNYGRSARRSLPRVSYGVIVIDGRVLSRSTFSGLTRLLFRKSLAARVNEQARKNRPTPLAYAQVY